MKTKTTFLIFQRFSLKKTMLVLTMLFGVVFAWQAEAQTGCENTSKWPSNAVTPNPDGSSTQISTCNYWSEYSEIGGIISGYEYEFDSVKNGNSAFVTVRIGSSGGAILAAGPGPLTVTANSSENLFVHWTDDANCGTSTGCATSTVSCITCATALDCEGVPGGAAQPGTPCDDGDPTTINDVWDADCNCAGIIPPDGMVCDAPIEIGSLPYTTTDNTENYGDDYGPADRPPLAPDVIGNPSSSYLNGDDVVYSYTPSADGLINISVTEHGSWAGVFVFTGCSPFQSTVGGHTNSSSTTPLEVEGLSVTAGTTYYIVISTFASPQTTPYTLTVTAAEGCEGTPEAGTAAIDISTGQTGTVAQISVAGYTDAVGITRIWQNKDENGDWVDTSLGDSDQVDVVFSGEQGDVIELRYAVTCSSSGETAYSNVISFTIDNVGCVPVYQYTSDYLSSINSVGAVTDINYSASAQPTGGYEDATTTVLEASAGQTFEINTTYVGGTNTVNIWIDWDGSGSFEESEKTGPSTGSADQVLEINVPDGAENGDYIMRVRGVYGSDDFGPCSFEGWGSGVDFTLRVVDPASCPAPTVLAVDNITENSAELSWSTDATQSDVYLVEAGEPAPDENSTPTDSGVSSPISLDNLMANTSYDAYVRSDCGTDGLSTWSGPVAFTTLATPPDNETCDTAMVLECGAEPITVSSAGSTAEAPIGGCTMGANGIWFSFIGTGGDITITSSASFDHEMSINSGTCSDLTNIDCQDSSTGTETYTIVGSTVDQMYYVYIAHWSGSSTTTGDITIDIDCAIVPECPAPTALSVTNITENSAELSWSTDVTQSDVYLVEAGEPAPDENSTPTDSGVSSPISLDNLMANTSYDAYVRSDCGTDGLSTWSGPVAFTTLATPPDNETCDTAMVLECGAEPITVSSAGSTAEAPSGGCTMGANGIWFSFIGTGGDITITSSADFDHEMSINAGSCSDLINIDCQDTSFGTETYIVEASTEGQMYYVYIAHWSGTSTTTGNITIDIDCAIAVECPAPTALAVANITETSAELSWTTSATQSDVYLVEAGEPAPDENSTPTDSGVSSPISLDNLLGNTSYDVYVRSDCGTDGVSAWAGPVAFTTLAAAPGNDDCSGAIALSCGVTVDGTNIGATQSDLGSPTCAGGSLADVFYTLDVTAGTEYTVTVQGDDYDGVLAIYSGECDSLVEIDCADNGFTSGAEETITYTPDANGTILIRTYDWSASGGSFTITVSCVTGTQCEAPTDVAVANITENSADITWTFADAADDQWEVSITTIDQSPDDGMIYDVFDNASYTATGLDAATEYFVYVRTVCSIDDSSAWSGATAFTTNEGEPEPCQDPYNDAAPNSDVFISNIELAGIGIDVGNPDFDFTYNSNSMSTTGYKVVTNPTLTVYPGLEGEYTVSSGPSGNSNQYYYVVWLDFNQDGCFDESEKVITSNDVIWGGGIPNGETGVVDVPMTWMDMAPGTYQARIRNSLIDHPMAEGNGDGEAIDFTVEVITEAEAELLLGIEGQSFTNFTFYPNPVKDQLNLNSSTPIEKVEVYNLLGQVIIQKQPNALEVNLATDQLQAGVYLMNVTIDGSQKTFRVVKE